MALFDNMPYTNLHEINLDWIIQQVKSLAADWETFDADMTAKYDNLHDYVYNYFAELDLNAEVQAIIDQMEADGTLQSMIDAAVTDADIPAIITSWLTTNVNPVGSAVVVDSSLTVSGAAADAKVVGDAFRSTNIYHIVDFSTAQQNKFISASGIVYDQNNYIITQPFAMPKGNTLVFSGYGWSPNTCMIAKYNADAGTYTPIQTSTQSAIVVYTYTATEDCKIVLCCNQEHAHSAQYFINLETVGDIGEMETNLDAIKKTLTDGGNFAEADLTNVTLDQYIHTNNVIAPSADFCYTSPVFVKAGSLITAIMRGYSTQVSIISEYDPITESYKSLVGSVDNTIRTYSYITTHDSYICFSYNYKFGHQAFIGDYKGNYNAGDLAIFERIGVIGDSFATGSLYYNNKYTEKYNISWPAVMSREHGIPVDNFSKGGFTTRTWLTHPAGLAAMNAATAADLYIIALGINDYYNLGINYLGTTADIESHADTFYGNMSTIIDSIAAHAPHAKIILSTMANTAEIPERFNNAIINIAIAKNVPYIVQKNCAFFKNPVYTNMRGSHPTAPAYAGMAEAFKDMIIECMYKNPQYFINMYMYN